MTESWHKLLRYESRDLVTEGYKVRNGREPNAARVLEITANFVQAREYFANASHADISVKPLLLYYGVLALCRGLILYCSTTKGPEALKPSHGLRSIDWSGTLAKGIGCFHELTVGLQAGTMLDLIEASDNKAYFKANCSAINWSITFPKPPPEARFRFCDILLGFADLRDDILLWRSTPFPSLQVDAIVVVSGRPKLTFTNGTTEEKVVQLFGTTYPGLEAGVDGSKVWALLPAGTFPCISQLTSKAFGAGIGDIHLIPPIGGSLYFNPLSLLYASSYFLGMAVRYFPSAWLSLARQGKGDRVFPLVVRLLSFIEDQVPEIVLQYLEAPHNFENKLTNATAT
jgi:hypothetical protein